VKRPEFARGVIHRSLGASRGKGPRRIANARIDLAITAFLSVSGRLQLAHIPRLTKTAVPTIRRSGLSVIALKDRARGKAQANPRLFVVLQNILAEGKCLRSSAQT